MPVPTIPPPRRAPLAAPTLSRPAVAILTQLRNHVPTAPPPPLIAAALAIDLLVDEGLDLTGLLQLPLETWEGQPLGDPATVHHVLLYRQPEPGVVYLALRLRRHLIGFELHIATPGLRRWT